MATLITLFREDGKPGELYLIVPARRPPKSKEWNSAEEFAAAGGFVADVTMTRDGRWRAAVPMLPGCSRVLATKEAAIDEIRRLALRIAPPAAA